MRYVVASREHFWFMVDLWFILGVNFLGINDLLTIWNELNLIYLKKLFSLSDESSLELLIKLEVSHYYGYFS